MGKKSTKENKKPYQIAREDASLTRTQASDNTDGLLTERRIELIEGNYTPHPDEVLLMAKTYNRPELCNYYCTNECEIGKKFVPQVETIHDLPQITLGLLSTLNTLNKERDEIINISADGLISEDEQEEFQIFLSHLSEMSLAIETLKLWAEKQL